MKFQEKLWISINQITIMEIIHESNMERLWSAKFQAMASYEMATNHHLKMLQSFSQSTQTHLCILYRWLSARPLYLHCKHNGGTTQTHWCWAIIYSSVNYAIIGSDNGLLLVWCHNLNKCWLIGPLRTNVREMWIKIRWKLNLFMGLLKMICTSVTI